MYLQKKQSSEEKIREEIRRARDDLIPQEQQKTVPFQHQKKDKKITIK